MDKSLRLDSAVILNTHNKFHHFNLPVCPLRLTFGREWGAPCDMVISPFPSHFSGKLSALKPMEQVK